MRETSPVVAFSKMPWWINLLIGLGLMAFGELLKLEEIAGASPVKKAVGEALQLLAVLFMVFALASFLITLINKFIARNVPAPLPQDPAPIRTVPIPPPPPPLPPAPPKKKYTERDFMPPSMRASLSDKAADASN